MSVLIRVSIGAIGVLFIGLVMMAVLAMAVRELLAGPAVLHRLRSAS